MAVGNSPFPVMAPVEGVQLGVTCAGIKKPNHRDLVVIELAAGGSLAGAFTKNAFCAAPVQVAKIHLAEGDANTPRYLVINTGNANAGTGQAGMRDARQMCISLATQMGVAEQQILPFSTGVIGEPLPIAKIETAIPDACKQLEAGNWASAAEGILTTDTRPKAASRTVELAGNSVVISGISKGSGMIKPNMATMLGFIATDLKVPEQRLQDMVIEMTEKSFNRITVDGDTSTNDSVILMASGKSGVEYDKLDSSDRQAFEQALQGVFEELAQLIIRDGEGATKFVSVVVSGALNTAEALKVAYTVAESPLVKTALFASDPNWGRILAAVGRAGVENLDIDKLTLQLNDVMIVENGGRAAFYSEEAGQAVMDGEEIVIAINLERGDCTETVWTSDLSHDYVTINAEYRT